MKEFNKLFINLKSIKTKKLETQFKKERIMKILTSFTKTITMSIKVTLILIMS